jgi:hypothetical protein
LPERLDRRTVALARDVTLRWEARQALRLQDVNSARGQKASSEAASAR